MGYYDGKQSGNAGSVLEKPTHVGGGGSHSINNSPMLPELKSITP
jgi:hypothetical protein